MLILLGASALLAGCGFSRSDKLPIAEQRKLIARYCFDCHSFAEQAGGVTLEHADLEHVARNAKTWEKVIHQLRSGLMPPPGEPRPSLATAKQLRESLEAAIDDNVERVAGPSTFQRLNRAEYARAVHDLLDLDVDVNVNDLLPPDPRAPGFDNVGDAQPLSPPVTEAYRRAAGKVAALALGEANASATSATYAVSSAASQTRQVEGAPFGTRGGVSVVHNFPAEADYAFSVSLQAVNGSIIGRRALDQAVEISINGERVALLPIDPRMSESRENGFELKTQRIFVKAGPQRLSAAFLQRDSGVADDLVAPLERPLADWSGAPQLLELPSLQSLTVTGPFDATGVADTPSRRRVFHCRPVTIEEQWACARMILSDLAERAYRRPISDDEAQNLLDIYDTGRSAGFEAGIRTAVQAILGSPDFVSRTAPRPADSGGDEPYRLGDFELASRLSFFLWSSVPDQDLLDLAREGRLHDQDELVEQVKRMLEDPRSSALATRFAAQWLQLARLDSFAPDARLYPNYDRTLAQALRRETELLFDSVVRDDSNVLDLLTADYTFVDERLAAYYKIPGVLSNRFRRVVISDEHRRGLLGQGSILALTSRADRTSPVGRGQWILAVLLGTPPPPPPPNVPLLEKTGAIKDGRLLALRERVESHRAAPACVSCHKMIDPLGLALENYDATGAWRIKDNGVPIDARVELFDGTTVNGPDELRASVLRYSDAFLTTFAENLLAYAIGRRVEYYDMPTVRDIVRRAREQDNKFSAFVLGIVESAPFRTGQVETIVAQR